MNKAAGLHLYGPRGVPLLYAEQLCIKPARLQELRPGPLLRNPPVLQHDNVIRTRYGAESVSDDHHSFILNELRKRFLDFQLIFRIKRCGRLIQQYDGCVFEQRAGNGNTLTFSAGKSAALTA